MKRTKIVFDTNVYLAAIRRDGYAFAQLQRAQPNGSFELFISPEIIIEVREKLEQKFHYTPEKSAAFVNTILMYATMIQPSVRVKNVLKDTDDHIILECALEAKAIIIATADRELLKLKDYEKISIVHPTMLQYM